MKKDERIYKQCRVGVGYKFCPKELLLLIGYVWDNILN